MTLLKRGRSILLVIDVQERLLPAMAMGNDVLARTRLLLQAAGELAVPVHFTEQYRKGLGATVADLTEAATAPTIHEKIAFSATADADVAAALAERRSAGRDQVVIAGIETHVCVAQSAFDLAGLGFETFVVADAVASRRTSDHMAALARLAQADIGVVTSEMVVFEWLGCAGSAEFKALAPLLKPL